MHYSQDHPQRKLLVPPVHAQPAVTASLRCSTAVIAMHRHVDHCAVTEGHSKKRVTHTIPAQSLHSGHDNNVIQELLKSPGYLHSLHCACQSLWRN